MQYDFMSSANMEDGLTHKISDIIRKNKQLRQQQEKETIFIPQKTQSIFFKHLPVNVTRQDLEEVCSIQYYQ